MFGRWNKSLTEFEYYEDLFIYETEKSFWKGNQFFFLLINVIKINSLDLFLSETF